jgi:phosphoribosyl-AMP cyclohydrolase
MSMRFTKREAGLDIEQGSLFAPLFDGDGLIPVIVTEAGSRDVVMFAWMNAEALARTIESGIATYWSRSRARLWIKGEESGNRQLVEELRTDCDQDALWLSVRVEGHGASCHTGQRSCFYRKVERAGSGPVSLIPTGEPPLFDPARTYKKGP